MAAASRDRLGDVRSLVVGQMPDYQVDCVLHCGEGRDNVAYEVNGELIVRFSKETDPARRTARLRQEARLLAAVAAISSLPVPEPRFTATEHGCLAYLQDPRCTTVGRGPAALVGPRHVDRRRARPATRRAPCRANRSRGSSGLVGTDDQPLAEWRRETADIYVTLARQVPVVHRRPVEAFLATPPPDGEIQLGVLPQRSGDRTRSHRPDRMEGDGHHRLGRCRDRRSGL